jgi:hypothetical protein
MTHSSAGLRPRKTQGEMVWSKSHGFFQTQKLLVSRYKILGIIFIVKCVDDMLCLFYVNVHTDMAPNKITAITDRATSNKAKAYIYGVKEIRKLKAVKETNIYVAKLMAYKPKEEHRYFIVINSALRFLFCVTLFVLYLYMVSTFFNT